MNRNYVRNSQGDPQLVSLPVTFENNNAKTIQNAIVQKEAHSEEWLMQKLSYYRKSPYYHPVLEIIRNAYASVKSNKLSDLNTKLTSAICDYLGIKFRYTFSSSIDYDQDRVKNSGDWAFEISKALKAETYINPISGYTLFDVSKFREANIELQFLQTDGFPFFNPFEKELQHFSILDTLFDCHVNTFNEVQENSCNLLSWNEVLSLQRL